MSVDRVSHLIVLSSSMSYTYHKYPVMVFETESRATRYRDRLNQLINKANAIYCTNEDELFEGTAWRLTQYCDAVIKPIIVRP